MEKSKLNRIITFKNKINNHKKNKMFKSIKRILKLSNTILNPKVISYNKNLYNKINRLDIYVKICV